jgi:hypothetical protein
MVATATVVTVVAVVTEQVTVVTVVTVVRERQREQWRRFKVVALVAVSTGGGDCNNDEWCPWSSVVLSHLPKGFYYHTPIDCLFRMFVFFRPHENPVEPRDHQNWYVFFLFF